MKKIYYGWYIVAIALVILTLIVGSIFTAFSLFVLPISESFGLSRADANTALILLNIGSAVTAPFIGRLIDRQPIRLIMLISTIVLGACLVLLSFSESILLSSVVLTLPLAIATLGAGTATAMALLPRWFTVYRSRAIAIAVLGMSIGGVIMPPAIGALIDSIGWRHTLLVMAAVLTAVLLQLTLFVRVKPGPDDHELGVDEVQSSTSDTAGAAQQGLGEPMTSTAIMKSAMFWILSLTTAIGMGVASALTVSLVPLAQDLGMNATRAASILSVISLGAVAGKLLVAWIGDRVESITSLIWAALLVAAVNFCFYLSEGIVGLMISSAFLGLALGAVVPIFYSALATVFGPASFGTANGLATPQMAIFGAIFIRLSGEVFDRMGEYGPLFLIFCGLQLFCALVLFLSKSKKTDVKEAPPS